MITHQSFAFPTQNTDLGMGNGPIRNDVIQGISIDPGGFEPPRIDQPLNPKDTLVEIDPWTEVSQQQKLEEERQLEVQRKATEEALRLEAELKRLEAEAAKKAEEERLLAAEEAAKKEQDALVPESPEVATKKNTWIWWLFAACAVLVVWLIYRKKK